MEKTFNQIDYANKFNKEHYKRVTILVPKDNENMLEWLNDHKPVSSYILKLIEDDINKNK